VANKKKARTAGGKGLKPMLFKLLCRRPDGTEIDDFPDGAERTTANAIELGLFEARTVDEAIGRGDWVCLAGCIEHNKKLIPYARLRKFIVLVLREEAAHRPPTEKERARRFKMAAMSRLFEQSASTTAAIAAVAETFGVDVRTVERARAENQPITTQAEVIAALQELHRADAEGLLEKLKGDKQ
jgi:hypothetical protein